MLAALWLRADPGRARRSDGRRGDVRRHAAAASGPAGGWPLGLVIGLYAAVALALALGSLTGVWPFPALRPEA